MNIVFEKFTEKHISDGVSLAKRELDMQKEHCPELPCCDLTEKITGILYWLSSQPFGKAAICDGRLVGYLLFAGPWDGFLGDVKGVFSPLFASAFSYEYADRGRLASMLFSECAEEFVQHSVYSCAVSRFAYDEEIASSFVLNGFGIRCCDAVRRISALEVNSTTDYIVCEELPSDSFKSVRHLQKGLHRHLEKAPVFFPAAHNDFDEWFYN